jgi:hypothetical protein
MIVNTFQVITDSDATAYFFYKKKSALKGLKILLSNGFPRLRICTTLKMGFLVFNFHNTWAGSSTLRTLNLPMEKSHDCEQLRSICPGLRRLTTNRHSMDETSTYIPMEKNNET